MPHFPTTYGAAAAEARRFMLVTNPRTCSNLLVRILALDKQPHTKHGGYHFLDCFFVLMGQGLLQSPPTQWTVEQRKAVWEKFRSSIDKLEEDLTPEQDTKILFTKEHVETITDPIAFSAYAQGLQTQEARTPEAKDETPMRWDVGSFLDEKDQRSPLNQTVFPDSYLDQWSPIFLVRHPIRAFESILRSFIDVFETEETTRNASKESKLALIRAHMTLSWTKTLWQFYESHHIPSLIIDADDLVTHPQATTQKLAEWVGFDKDVLQYTWTEATDSEKEAKQAAMRRMLSSLDASAGVQADPKKLARNAGSPAEQVPRWTDEFGQEYAEMLKEWVEKAMPDYEFLLERRMMPEV